MKMGYIASMLLAGAMGCASIQDRPVSELKVDNPRFSLSTKNYFGSEQEAIGKMMDAALSADQEDAWLEYAVDGKTCFADVGAYGGVNKIRFADQTTGQTIVEIPQKNITPNREKIWKTLSSLSDGTKVRFYHIHPFEERDLDNLDIRNLEFIVDQRTFPSAADYTADIQTRVMARKLCPHVEMLPSRVVGIRGYSDYSTTEGDLGVPELNPDNTKALDDIFYDIQWTHLVKASCLNPTDTLEGAREGLNNSGLKICYTVLREVPEKIKEKAAAHLTGK